jgi:hypothetical protein
LLKEIVDQKNNGGDMVVRRGLAILFHNLVIFIVVLIIDDTNTTTVTFGQATKNIAKHFFFAYQKGEDALASPNQSCMPSPFEPQYLIYFSTSVHGFSAMSTYQAPCSVG